MLNNTLPIVTRLNDFIKLSNSLASFVELSDLLNLSINKFFNYTALFVCEYIPQDKSIVFLLKNESSEFISQHVVELLFEKLPNINEPYINSSIQNSQSEKSSISYIPILNNSNALGFLVAYKKDASFTEEEIALNNCIVSILENVFYKLHLIESRSSISKELGDRCVEREELIKTANQSVSESIESARIFQIKELENKAILNSIINNSDYYLWALDKSYNILFINNPYKRAVFRATGKDIKVGDNILSYMDKEEFDKYTDFFTKTFNGAKCSFENIQVINGIQKTYQLNFYPIYLDESNVVIGMVSFTRDISDEKDVFNEMSNELKKERGLNKYLNKFISMISHEYKTPLTTIATSTYILERMFGKTVEPKVDRQLKAINKSIDKINVLLNQTLTLSKIETNKLCFIQKATYIKEHFESILYAFSNDERKRIIFEYSGDNEQIVYASIAITIIADNLLANALKFSPYNKEVLFGVEKTKTNISFRIKDFGDGISSADLEFIFEPFYRGDSAVGIEGSGLGLAIAREITESFGGTIAVNSVSGYGSEFIVNLPINK